MTKYYNRAVTYTVQIIMGSDNRDSDNQGPTVLLIHCGSTNVVH